MQGFQVMQHATAVSASLGRTHSSKLWSNHLLGFRTVFENCMRKSINLPFSKKLPLIFWRHTTTCIYYTHTHTRIYPFRHPGFPKAPTAPFFHEKNLPSASRFLVRKEQSWRKAELEVKDMSVQLEARSKNGLHLNL